MSLYNQEVANILIEALPYIHRFSGNTMVIKFGGNAMSDDDLLEKFALDIVILKAVGIYPIVVHGGGPQIDNLLNRVGKKGEFIGGLRVTDKETMEIVEMVLGGQISKKIVAMMQKNGGKAISITGKDGNLIEVSKKMPVIINGKEVDFGLVGEIENINPKVLKHLAEGGYVPVIAPIGVDQKGQSYNINADTVAGKLAVALQASKLIMLTNITGVLDKTGKLLTGITPADIDTLIADGTIYGGMIPKIESAVDAARHGVPRVHIVDGRVDHAILLELFTNSGVGTLIQSQR